MTRMHFCVSAVVLLALCPLAPATAQLLQYDTCAAADAGAASTGANSASDTHTVGSDTFDPSVECIGGATAFNNVGDTFYKIVVGGGAACTSTNYEYTVVPSSGTQDIAVYTFNAACSCGTQINQQPAGGTEGPLQIDSNGLPFFAVKSTTGDSFDITLAGIDPDCLLPVELTEITVD